MQVAAITCAYSSAKTRSQRAAEVDAKYDTQQWSRPAGEWSAMRATLEKRYGHIESTLCQYLPPFAPSLLVGTALGMLALSLSPDRMNSVRCWILTLLCNNVRAMHLLTCDARLSKERCSEVQLRPSPPLAATLSVAEAQVVMRITCGLAELSITPAPA